MSFLSNKKKLLFSMMIFSFPFLKTRQQKENRRKECFLVEVKQNKLQESKDMSY